MIRAPITCTQNYLLAHSVSCLIQFNSYIYHSHKIEISKTVKHICFFYNMHFLISCFDFPALNFVNSNFRLVESNRSVLEFFSPNPKQGLNIMYIKVNIYVFLYDLDTKIHYFRFHKEEFVISDKSCTF